MGYLFTPDDMDHLLYHPAIETVDICPFCGQHIKSVPVGWGTYNLRCPGKINENGRPTTCQEEKDRAEMNAWLNSSEAEELFKMFNERNEKSRCKYRREFVFFKKKLKAYSSAEAKEEAEKICQETMKSLWQKIAKRLGDSFVAELELTETNALNLRVESVRGYFKLFQSYGFGKVGFPPLSWGEEVPDIFYWHELRASKKIMHRELKMLAVREIIADYLSSTFPLKEEFDDVLSWDDSTQKKGFVPDFGDRNNQRVILYECSLTLDEGGSYGVYFSSPNPTPLGRKDKRGYDLYRHKVVEVVRLYW